MTDQEIRAKINDLEYENKKHKAYLDSGSTGVGGNNAGIVAGVIMTFTIFLAIIGLPIWIGNAIAKSSKLNRRQEIYRTIQTNEAEIHRLKGLLLTSNPE